MNIKNEVKELTSENKIRQSIRLLKEWLYKTGNEQLENELILLDNRYNRVKEKERNNTATCISSTPYDPLLLNTCR